MQSTRVCKHEKEKHKEVSMQSIQVRKHAKQVSMQAYNHAKHVNTQARQTRNLADSVKHDVFIFGNIRNFSIEDLKS